MFHRTDLNYYTKMKKSQMTALKIRINKMEKQNGSNIMVST